MLRALEKGPLSGPLGRAFGSHPRGREFESLQVHQMDIGRTPIISRAALP